MPAARFLMTDPSHYAVRYRINPWMRPEVWRADDGALSLRAFAASRRLAGALAGLGAAVEWVPAAADLPDLVFPANAGVALDGKVLAARFRCPERQGEEPLFRRAFERLAARGLLREIVDLPPGCFHEGAGDALWDQTRGLIWTGWGQRSDREAGAAVAAAFGRPVVPLQLASPRYYHLDTCFRPLDGGHILYYPPAFTPAALAAIRTHAAPDQLIEATDEDAAAFCVNAVNLGADVVMAQAPPPLRERLGALGYRVHEIDLSPFILSGGAAFCMTLRLDLTSRPMEPHHDRHHDARALA